MGRRKRVCIAMPKNMSKTWGLPILHTNGSLLVPWRTNLAHDVLHCHVSAGGTGLIWFIPP